MMWLVRQCINLHLITYTLRRNNISSHIYFHTFFWKSVLSDSKRYAHIYIYIFFYKKQNIPLALGIFHKPVLSSHTLCDIRCKILRKEKNSLAKTDTPECTGHELWAYYMVEVMYHKNMTWVYRTLSGQTLEQKSVYKRGWYVCSKRTLKSTLFSHIIHYFFDISQEISCILWFIFKHYSLFPGYYGLFFIITF